LQRSEAWQTLEIRRENQCGNPDAKKLKVPPGYFTFQVSIWNFVRMFAKGQQGVAMLSSVLRSDRAAQVNVAIIRTFVKLRELLATHEELARKVAQHDRQIAALFEYVKTLLEPPPAPKKPPIGFIHPKG
jgi:hypothetical protein